MKDEDLDRCPRCKEDMWAGNAICRNCQWDDDMDEWPGACGIECDICGHVSTAKDGRHDCHEDSSND